MMTGTSEGEEREKGIENVFEEIMAENYKPKEGNRYPDTESTEGPKQDEHNQIYTNTYYNKKKGTS